MSTLKAPYKGDGTGTLPRAFREKHRTHLQLLFRDLLPEHSREDEGTTNGAGGVSVEFKWASRADQAVDDVIAEAMWAASELHWHRLAVTREESRIELTSLCLDLDRIAKLLDAHASGSSIRRGRLVTLLRKTSQRLRNLSLQTDGLLPVSADPRRCADDLDQLVMSVESHSSLWDVITKAPSVLQGTLALRADVAGALAELEEKSMPSERLQSQREREAWVAQELALRVSRVLVRYGIPLSSSDNSSAIAALKSTGEGIGLVMDHKSWQPYLLEARQQEQTAQERL
ncbi:hypothetical protein [Methyloversatilis sp.]|uniref:hypothetical protein n=1 Tax=Methyloversatilis sp. TaxID=2569862 RepID=UPI0027B9AE32|nr:hypothetical protein [Methyloversatilis sp.]